MDTKINFRSLVESVFESIRGDSRAQVYLIWAALTGVGYVATHHYQQQSINAFWLVLSVIGLGYMSKVMPLRVSQMKKIYIAWLIPIAFGIVASALAFYVDSLAELIGYLGAFWLIVQAAGFFWNGLVDPPSDWYYIAAVVNVAAGVACYLVDSLASIQYLVAAIVTVWSMLILWVYRT